MSESITFDVTLEDYQNQKGFFNINNCLLATAAKRAFPNKKISVGGDNIRVENIRYKLSQDIRDKVHKVYGIPSGKRFQPFTVIAHKLIK